MKEKYLNITTSFITKYHAYSSDEMENLRYGLEGLYLTITKLIIIFTVSILLHMFKELCILLVLFNIIRFTGFGFHAKKSYECLICSTLLFIGLPKLFSYLEIDKSILLILGIIGIIVLGIYAPADTIKRPLINKRKRIIRKVATILIGLTYTILSQLISNYTISYLLICAILLESVMVNPLTYIIFKQPYRNYKNCQKA